MDFFVLISMAVFVVLATSIVVFSAATKKADQQKKETDMQPVAPETPPPLPVIQKIEVPVVKTENTQIAQRSRPRSNRLTSSSESSLRNVYIEYLNGFEDDGIYNRKVRCDPLDRSRDQRFYGVIDGIIWRQLKTGIAWPHPTDKEACTKMLGFEPRPIRQTLDYPQAEECSFSEEVKLFVKLKIDEELARMKKYNLIDGTVVLRTVEQSNYAMIAFPRTKRISDTCIKITLESLKPKKECSNAKTETTYVKKPSFPEPVLVDGESIVEYHGSCV